NFHFIFFGGNKTPLYLIVVSLNTQFACFIYKVLHRLVPLLVFMCLLCSFMCCLSRCHFAFCPDLHVLQWRHGCEVVQEGDEVKFSKGISEYGYDGENFLSFDNKESQWVTSVDAALPTKRKWDNVPILNMYTKGYLEKECVDWLNKFREYDNEELRKASPPDVRVFARKSSDESKLKLTCLVTGFYSEDVTMTIRKYRTSLCENEVESTGIRPNHDGTFQLRKSVEINENEKSEYDCFVSHRTFKEPVIVQCATAVSHWKPCFLSSTLNHFKSACFCVICLFYTSYIYMHRNNQ
uniref:Ig-like domain-containing protein n=1 Tax=Cyprinus carpio TaxID=7962 RepID=A0A8C1ZUU7_CYPCA